MPLSPPRATRHPVFWWVVWIAWFALLYALSSTSGFAPKDPPIRFYDKVLHAVYFAGGGAALLLALSLGARRRPPDGVLLIACLAMAAAVGWFDEWHQSHTPGRSGNDLGDWIADVVGGGLGWGLGLLLRRWIIRSATCP